jgi:hypothetical protein
MSFSPLILWRGSRSHRACLFALLHIAKIAAETCKWERNFLGHLILKLPDGVVFTQLAAPAALGIWMDDALGHEITQLLLAWRRGDEGALDKLTPQVYRELHLAARRCMGGEHDGHTLQTTELINELYVRLSGLKLIDWQNRTHFFALCARQMRRILTDQARARRSHKRGDGAKAISLDDALAISPETILAEAIRTIPQVALHPRATRPPPVNRERCAPSSSMFPAGCSKPISLCRFPRHTKRSMSLKGTGTANGNHRCISNAITSTCH